MVIRARAEIQDTLNCHVKMPDAVKSIAVAKNRIIEQSPLKTGTSPLMTLTAAAPKAPKSAAVFVLDCSASMNRVIPFKDGTDANAATRDRTPLDVMKEYVKAKIVQRIMRDLKTLPVAVLAFGYHKTKNILTTRAKDVARENGQAFDRQNDAYQGVYELVPFAFTFDQSTLERVEQAVAGQALDGDAHTGLIAAIETLDTQGSIAKYPTKEIFVLTDGESVTDWDEWKGTVRRLKEKGMSVKVVGVNFDDEYIPYEEENKSDVKRENEIMFHKIVKKLGGDASSPSIVANAVAAVQTVSAPNLRTTNSRADHMTLRLGDPEGHPDRSLVLHVEVKKAVVPAPIPSMKKMSLAGFDRIQETLEASQTSLHGQRAAFSGTKRDHSAIDAEEEGEGGGGDSSDRGERPLTTRIKVMSKAKAAERSKQQERSALAPRSMGQVGANYEKTLRSAGLQEPDEVDADLASHDVTTERRYFYRPTIDPKKVSSTVRVKQKTILGGDSDEEAVVGRGEDGADAERREIPEDAELQDAYFYGGDLVPFGDYNESFGKLGGLVQGMEVISFMKVSDVRYDWRMGDAFYVYASVGQSGSERLFSAFVNGMEERKTCAVVRFVKKGFNSTKLGTLVMPDPQLGILFPATNEESQSEFCYYIRLPFGEDIRSPGFASLSNLFNRKGQRIESHPHLPTKTQDHAMDDFVDAMNLDDLAELDENGDKMPWFNIHESYSPAIHNIQNTLMFRLGSPDGDLPAVPPVLTRYLDPPQRLVHAASEPKQAAIAAFKVLAVPPKPKKTTKANENYVQPEDEKAESAYAALFGHGGTASGSTTKAPRISQVKIGAAAIELRDSQTNSQSSSTPALAPVANEDENMEEEPKTEDEDDGEDATLTGSTPATSVATTTTRAPDPGESVPQLVDGARRLIETSFSTQNFAKATAELRTARNEASKRNSPASYNAAIRSFAKHLNNHKHRDYLAQIEAEDLGLLVGNGTTENDAEDFLEALN